MNGLVGKMADAGACEEGIKRKHDGSNREMQKKQRVSGSAYKTRKGKEMPKKQPRLQVRRLLSLRERLFTQLT